MSYGGGYGSNSTQYRSQPHQPPPVAIMPMLVPRDFLGRPAPAGYIAGLGRGATGFTTRSDIGPAREASAASLLKDKEDDDSERFQNDDLENETGLFNSLPYEADDEEADRIYAAVDGAMGERRRARRQALENSRKLQLAQERPKLAAQFSDVKQALATLSQEAWEAIPSAANISRRKAKKDLGRERFVPVPDSVLSSVCDRVADNSNRCLTFSSTDTASNIAATVSSSSSLSSSSRSRATTSDGAKTDFVEMGVARDRVLGVKLDQVSDSVTGQTVVDPKGYLTNLGSVLIKSEAEIGDIKKARLLLKSVITTNRGHAPGWIAAARLEEIAGRTTQARELITRGCVQCQKNEDIWIEAARLHTRAKARGILASAVAHVPTSVKVWLAAAKLEEEGAPVAGTSIRNGSTAIAGTRSSNSSSNSNTDTTTSIIAAETAAPVTSSSIDPIVAQRRVLQRALEFVPNSVKLWKAIVSLETEPEDARKLLVRAVECVPLSVELWLTLAKLESYDNARKVLNRARMTIPTSHEIWVAAATLEESQGNYANVDVVIGKAVHSLAQRGTVMSREQWLHEAQECERHGAVHTCRAIIRHTIGMNVEVEDCKATCVADAEQCIERGCIGCARAVYEHALATLPHKKSLWRRAVFLEKEHGGPGEQADERQLQLLKRAVVACPQAEMLWLMFAKLMWVGGDVEGARGVLAQAFLANPASPQIWLAAVKLEQESHEYERARVFLARAREKAGGEPRVWMKSAMLERQLDNMDECIALLKAGVERFSSFAKFWLIWAQLEAAAGNVERARQVYVAAQRTGAWKSEALWVEAARLEEECGRVNEARAVLERGRQMHGGRSAALWFEAVRQEARAGNDSEARKKLARGLQECPDSGVLWGEAICMETRAQRRAKSLDALRRCGESDPYVCLAIARVFWGERKADKARAWFQRAVKADSDYGDAWSSWYRFECEQQEQQEQKKKENPEPNQHREEEAASVQGGGANSVLLRCVAAAPRHGEQWARMAKKIGNHAKRTEDILQQVALVVVGPV